MSLEHRTAFTSLIGESDKQTALRLVEAEQDISKGRLKMIEEMILSAPATDPAKKQLLAELSNQAQQGDTAALEQLRSAGTSAIPVLIQLKNERLILPSVEIRNLLAELEQQADGLLESQSSLLDADTLEALAQRERNYGEILKRAVIALEGVRRPKPHWLPFIYMYGLGFIPFLFGIIASVVYYQGFKPKILALIAGSYIFYVCFIGFFQFFAPWIG
ncbi:MAG: hypothetical protein GY869_16265 [Planctomycetes bacterium]|nr:hypothetical protein [Planctomycetota bacterium]